jgi:hypothetical protein
MFILEAIMITYNIYKFLGVVQKVYHVYNYGRDTYYIISKISKYFSGNKKKQPDLTDSFLIEKQDLENSWQLINIHAIAK